MKLTLKLFLIIAAFQFLAVNSFAQNNEKLDKWLAIKPIISTRKDIEKMYGKAENISFYEAEYKRPEFTVDIDYSRANCKLYENDYRVPEWTVIKVTYFLRKKYLVKDLQLDTQNYELKQSSDTPYYFEYDDKKRGLTITYDKEQNRVAEIIVAPSEQQKSDYGCHTAH